MSMAIVPLLCRDACMRWQYWVSNKEARVLKLDRPPSQQLQSGTNIDLSHISCFQFSQLPPYYIQHSIKLILNLNQLYINLSFKNIAKNYFIAKANRYSLYLQIFMGCLNIIYNNKYILLRFIIMARLFIYSLI